MSRVRLRLASSAADPFLTQPIYSKRQLTILLNVPRRPSVFVGPFEVDSRNDTCSTTAVCDHLLAKLNNLTDFRGPQRSLLYLTIRSLPHAVTRRTLS